MTLGLLSCGQAMAQQTGATPIPARRSGEAATPAIPTPVEPETPATGASDPAPVVTTPLSPAAAAAVASATTRPPPPRSGQTSLLIEVEGGRPDLRISVAIYRDAETFRRGERPVRVLTLNREGPVSRAFQLGLPAGRYAIVAWQDADGNGKPTRTRFGGASEPTGYSRNAHVRFGMPRFDDAAFEIGGSGVTQRITLRGR